MSWADTRHECALPFEVHSLEVVKAYWECDHCKKTWKVTHVSNADEYGVSYPVFERRVGDRIITRYKDPRRG